MPSVYFIRCEETGLIKIGTSADPWARLSKMQSDSPGALTLLAFEDGDERVERQRHEMFADARVRGEWFRPTQALVDHIASLPPAGSRHRRAILCIEGTLLGDTELARDLGMGRSTWNEMRTGARPITLEIALRLHAHNGDRIGPLREATESEIATLRRYVLCEPFYSAVRRVEGS